MTLIEIEKMSEDEVVETDFELKNRFLIALQTLSKYTDDIKVNPGHDQLWSNLDENQIEKMSIEDVKTMLMCGWFINEETWSCFC